MESDDEPQVIVGPNEQPREQRGANTSDHEDACDREKPTTRAFRLGKMTRREGHDIHQQCSPERPTGACVQLAEYVAAEQNLFRHRRDDATHRELPRVY